MLVINEIWIVREQSGKSYRQGMSGWYEPYTDDLGRLFRSLQKEYGRCRSKVYQDTPDGSADPIGWVFERVRHYKDTGQPYVAETWVTYKHVLKEAA